MYFGFEIALFFPQGNQLFDKDLTFDAYSDHILETRSAGLVTGGGHRLQVPEEANRLGHNLLGLMCEKQVRVDYPGCGHCITASRC